MIGVDISDRSIKVVEVTDDDNPVLLTLGWAALEIEVMQRGEIKDVVQVRQALIEALANCSPDPVRGIEMTASIPEVQSFVKEVEVPRMKESDMGEAVRWAVKRHLPFDLERVYIDWEPLGGVVESGKMQSVLVGAAQRDVVDPLLAVMGGLEFNVVALELEAQALRRCLLPRDLNGGMDIRGVLVVDLGATSTNMLLYDQGGMRFTISIPDGGDDITRSLIETLHMTPQQAIDTKSKLGLGVAGDDDAGAVALREAARNLVGKIERAVAEIMALMPADRQVKVVLLTGGGANLAGLSAIFSHFFPGVPVQLGNPWANLSRGKLQISSGDAMHFTTALGLALRQPVYDY